MEEETEVKPVKKLSYKNKLMFASDIAEPMASKSLCKKLFKLLKAAVAENKKSCLVIGLKDVQKAIRIGQKGLALFGADISPVDIVIHMPAVCEENDIPYCYVPLRKDIGQAIGLTRSVALIMVKENASYKELYDECFEEVGQLRPIY